MMTTEQVTHARPKPAVSAAGRTVGNTAPTTWRSLAVDCAAIVLFLASGLKAYELVTARAQPAHAWTVVQVAAEALLGAWLISRRGVRAAHAVATGCFGLFAAIALWKGVRGEATCGCFGPLRMAPMTTFWFDVGVLALLLVARGHGRVMMWHTPLRDALAAAALAALVGVTCLVAGMRSTHGAARATEGGAGAAPRPVTATVFSADRLGADLGYVRPGSRHLIRYAIANESDRELKIVNVIADCSCTRLSSPPTSVPPRATAEFDVTFDAPDQALRYAKRIVLETDSATRPSIHLELQARIGLPVRANPSALCVSRADEPTSPRRIELANEGADAVNILSASCDAPGYAAELGAMTLVPGGTSYLLLHVRPSEVDFGRREVRIQISTDATTQRDVYVLINQR